MHFWCLFNVLNRDCNQGIEYIPRYIVCSTVTIFFESFSNKNPLHCSKWHNNQRLLIHSHLEKNYKFVLYKEGQPFFLLFVLMQHWSSSYIKVTKCAYKHEFQTAQGPFNFISHEQRIWFLLQDAVLMEKNGTENKFVTLLNQTNIVLTCNMNASSLNASKIYMLRTVNLLSPS